MAAENRSIPKSNHELLDIVLSKLNGAYSDGTIRAYRTDINTYLNWCASKLHSKFPFKPEQLAQFIEYQSEYCSASTIKRRLAAIGKIHELMGLDNPTSNSVVKLSLRRCLRSKTLRPRQALGLNADMRDKLIKGLA